MLILHPSGEVVDRATGKPKKQYATAGGLRFVRHDGRSMYVHKLIAAEFLKNPDGFKYVRHVNGDRDDNSVLNLEYSKHRSAPKLSAEAVHDIRESTAPGVSLATEYGVSGATITNIRKGRRWI